MRIKKRTGDRIFKIVAVLFVTLFALICLYPLMMVVSVSFSNETEVLLNGYSVFPQAPTLDTYRYIFVNSGAKIARSYAVTIFITAVGTIGSLLVTSMCAFALSIKKLRYRNVIAYLCNFNDRIFRRACPVVLHLHQCPAPEKQRVVADYTQPVQCLEYVPDADLSFPGSICTI